jgi:signal transduction histidine kinase
MLEARNYSIKRKLTWMNMVVSGSTLLLACAAFAVYELSALRTNLARNMSIQAQLLGTNSISAVLFNDPDSARNTLAALEAAPNIIAAGIDTPDRESFAMYSRDHEPKPPALPRVPPGQVETHQFTAGELILVREIIFQAKPVGLVWIRSDLQDINNRLIRYGGIVAAVLLVSLIAAFFLSSIFQRATARPITQLAGIARVVSREKNYSIRAPGTERQDEIAVLIDAFNEMLEQIQQRDMALESAREELELRVTQRTAELQQVNQELEAFTYSVAHDLRAPLRHIQGFADLLKEDFGAQLDPAASTYLNRITTSTQRMGQLINDLLGLAHLGRQELRRQTVSLDFLLGTVLRDLKQENDGREIEWRIGKLAFAECDPGLIKQVFYNLLSNAAKYTRPRKPAIIEVGQSKEELPSVIFVRDNGVGFNMKYANKLFGVFERLHRREDFEGTGIGLATVQRIIHKHGGRIWAEAEVDQGATFYFTLGKSPNLPSPVPPVEASGS